MQTLNLNLQLGRVENKTVLVQPSEYWLRHFYENFKIERVDWTLIPTLTDFEKSTILPSLKAWQLGETSDGSHLIQASERYALRTHDTVYTEAVRLFIKEEQKHGNNLGKYLDLIGEKRIGFDWGDFLFRKIRYFNMSIELWTLTVITVESTAQLFYQSLKDATDCPLLKQICTDILIDEAYHIDFQSQRMLAILNEKPKWAINILYFLYKIFYFTTVLVVWSAHKKVFKAGGNTLNTYWRKMKLKFRKTIERQIEVVQYC